MSWRLPAPSDPQTSLFCFSGEARGQHRDWELGSGSSPDCPVCDRPDGLLHSQGGVGAAWTGTSLLALAPQSVASANPAGPPEGDICPVGVQDGRVGSESASCLCWFSE